MRHHIGVLALLFALAVGAALAWFVIDSSVPGFRHHARACHCTRSADDGESADDDAPELL